MAAPRDADGGDGVLLIGDLGSAVLTAETVVELLDEEPAGGVLVLDVPLVEGGVAAAVAAQGGDPLEAVARAASGEPPAAPPADAARSLSATVVLTDPAGLHARPAADLVRAVGAFDARVTVDGADAGSLLAVLARGLRTGASVELRASGPDARQALAAAVAVLEREG